MRAYFRSSPEHQLSRKPKLKALKTAGSRIKVIYESFQACGTTKVFLGGTRNTFSCMLYENTCTVNEN